MGEQKTFVLWRFNDFNPFNFVEWCFIMGVNWFSKPTPVVFDLNIWIYTVRFIFPFHKGERKVSMIYDTNWYTLHKSVHVRFFHKKSVLVGQIFNLYLDTCILIYSYWKHQAPGFTWVRDRLRKPLAFPQKTPTFS